ncbi:MAG TPA: hypothetical protein ENK18_05395 [Deltaproteobacteria bacterium]|nr:hypothetical protein [Deltaproteobacteria bacterium]
MNVPPEIVAPKEDPSVLLLIDEINNAQVVARDEDGDDLVVFWSVPGGVPYTERITKLNDFTVFIAELPRAEVLHGSTITATIIEDRPFPESTDHLFLVEVP